MNVQLEWSAPLRGAIDTQDEIIIFTLTLILIAMMIDFLLGSFAAKFNTDVVFRSKEGINGIIRKLGSIVLLTFGIPLSILLPEGIGLATLQVLYTGYLFYELKSIIENLEKLGVDTDLFKKFIERFKQIDSGGKHDKE